MVTSFEEKPARPQRPGERRDVRVPAVRPRPRAGGRPVDIGTHLLPRLVRRAVAVPVGDAFLIDIGTPEALARAEAEWPQRGVA